MIRVALAKSVTEATEYIVERGAVEESVPVLIRFITQIAERFEINVTEKVAAECVPLVGAVGGAAINLMFINHFQDMAHGHFIVRRLERTYSPEIVKAAYLEL